MKTLQSTLNSPRERDDRVVVLEAKYSGVHHGYTFRSLRELHENTNMERMAWKYGLFQTSTIGGSNVCNSLTIVIHEVTETHDFRSKTDPTKTSQIFGS